MKAATFAPAYCALYPKLAELAREHGYALAVHGTMGRDFDLIAVPWMERTSPPSVVVADLVANFDIRNLDGDKPELKDHGRIAYTLSVGFGECALDLSFMPPTEAGDANVARDRGRASHGRTSMKPQRTTKSVKLRRFTVTTRVEFVQDFYAYDAKGAAGGVRQNWDNGVAPVGNRRVLSCKAMRPT